MTDPQQVAAFLNARKPSPYCDESIQKLLKLKRHQQAQQAGRVAGRPQGGFTRSAGICANCHKQLTVTHA